MEGAGGRPLPFAEARAGVLRHSKSPYECREEDSGVCSLPQL